MTTNKPKVVDLFCGAGGMSLGFREAGFEVVQAYDFNKHAVASHAHNLGPHVQELSITEDLDLPPCDVIVGGPPCQGFSSAGMRRDGDHRNTLVSVFAKLIVKHRPRAFVFENVEGFLTGEGGARVLDLLEPVIGAGYRVHLRKVNAANYGVPQHRKRVIGFGFLRADSAFPEPTHRAHGAPGAHLAATHRPPTPTLLEALHGLPPPSTTKPGEPQGHIIGRLSHEDATRIENLLPGGTMRDLPEDLWHDSYKRRANRRVMDGTPTERRGGAPCGLRRLIGDEPSKAITSFARNEFAHPTEHRFLTLRECARIQTFPDWFEFMGNQSDQALLIGNAVPPRFAEVVARHVLQHLNAPGRRHSKGALLSFVPTGSTGMSPALQKTTQMVHSRFGGHDEVEGGAPDPTCVIDPTRCIHAVGDQRATAESTARHLQEVRNILATMWWRFTEAGDASHAEQANACLGAVIAAEATMHAADAYMAHPTKATRAALARACRRRTS